MPSSQTRPLQLARSPVLTIADRTLHIDVSCSRCRPLRCRSVDSCTDENAEETVPSPSIEHADPANRAHLFFPSQTAPNEVFADAAARPSARPCVADARSIQTAAVAQACEQCGPQHGKLSMAPSLQPSRSRGSGLAAAERVGTHGQLGARVVLQRNRASALCVRRVIQLVHLLHTDLLLWNAARRRRAMMA